jgi:SseB protein N-terminal domain
MRKLLGSLFRKRSSLHVFARKGDPAAFANALATARIRVLGALAGPGLAMAEVTTASYLAVVEEAALELAGRQSLLPFVYEDAGERLLPVFTSQECADAFCGAYCDRQGRLFPFTQFSVSGSSLAGWLVPGIRLVIDPQSDSELVIENSTLDHLRLAWASPGAVVPIDISGDPPEARQLLAPWDDRESR